MITIALIPNKVKDPDFAYTRQTIQYLSGRAKVRMSTEYNFLGGMVAYVAHAALFDGVQSAISLGGDGTLLALAQQAAVKDIPVLGINLGNLGFLAAVEKADIAEAVDKLCKGDYEVEERMMLEAQVVRDSKVIKKICALNDIVVSRAAYSRLLRLNIMVDDILAESFVADGIIVATPTGSTAYNLSAGGPVLDPSIQAMVTTPICPHTMQTRSLILPAEKTVEIVLGAYGGHESMVSADGQGGVSLSEGDRVVVRRSPYTTKLVKINSLDFYHTVRLKFSERGGLA